MKDKQKGGKKLSAKSFQPSSIFQNAQSSIQEEKEEGREEDAGEGRAAQGQFPFKDVPGQGQSHGRWGVRLCAQQAMRLSGWTGAVM